MYCSGCGTPLAAGLSYCNRCGMNLKERSETSGNIVASYLTAISLVGVAGIGLMLGGAIALKNGAQFNEELIGVFMTMTFFIVAFIEFFLCRQLSRFSKTQVIAPMSAPPAEFRAPQPAQRALAEPISSVTENTTRTLEYSRKDTSS